MKQIYLSILICFLVSGLFAQDIHFSQYYAAPLQTNPAFTAVFNGQYRINLNFRNQWRTASPGAYKTVAASTEFSLLKRNFRKDFIGMGFSGFYDKGGEASISLGHLSYSFNYNKALSKNKAQYLAFGFQLGYAQRSLDLESLVFDSQFTGIEVRDFYSSGEQINQGTYRYLDNAVGVMWYMKPSEKSNLYVGGSIHHINGPNQSFFRTEQIQLYRKVSLQAGLEATSNKVWHFMPKFLYLRQGPSQEFNLGFTTRLTPTPYKYGTVNSVYTGMLYRMNTFLRNDAVILLIGGEYKNVNIGLAMDINVSQFAQATVGLGGAEVAISYIIPQSLKGGSDDWKHCPVMGY